MFEPPTYKTFEQMEKDIIRIAHVYNIIPCDKTFLLVKNVNLVSLSLT